MLKFNIKIVILFTALLFLHNCQTKLEQPETDKTKILLINPSSWYLQSFVYLAQNNIIKVPNLQFDAVFYEGYNNHYDEVKKYVENRNINFVKPEKVSGELTPDILFQNNELSNTFHRLFIDSDAILFLGGADFPPEIYHHKTNLLTGIQTPGRHYFEISFLFHLLGGSRDENFVPFLNERPDLVVYGFCLGIQSMNSATGGTMYQDIPSEIYGLKYVEDLLQTDINNQHRNYWTALSPDPMINRHNFHRIQLSSDGFFINRMKLNVDDKPLVCSSHHQAVQEIGKDLDIIATSLDGKIVEGLHHFRKAKS